MKWTFPLFALLLLLSTTSFAADDSSTASQELSNPFSDFVPFEDEYDIDEDERFMYFGRFFAMSLGTGLHRFGGNIGKLYNTAIPVVDFKLIYFFDFRLAGQVGFSSASHAFDAEPSGVVEVNLLRLNGDLKYYFDTKELSAALTSANPFVVVGLSNTFRTQAFQTQSEAQRDNAFAVSGGLGMEFAIKPRKTSIGLEGRMHQIFFKDRYEETYLPSGIPDLTGNMYSLTTSLIFFF